MALLTANLCPWPVSTEGAEAHGGKGTQAQWPLGDCSQYPGGSFPAPSTWQLLGLALQ